MVVRANQATPETKMVIEPGSESTEEIAALSKAMEFGERGGLSFFIGYRSVVEVENPIKRGQTNEHGENCRNDQAFGESDCFGGTQFHARRFSADGFLRTVLKGSRGLLGNGSPALD